MAQTATPYGAQPISDSLGTPRAMRIPNGITSGYAANIFKFAPVRLDTTTGTLVAVTNPGGVPDPIFGIFAGVEYTPLGGRPAVSPFWPSGTTVDPTQDFFAYVWPAWTPSTRIKIQADGAVAQSMLGRSFNFTNLTAGNTQVGLSLCTVGSAGAGAGAQGQLTLVEFGFDVGNAIGDAYTDLICEIAYPQVGWTGKASIA